MFNLSWQPGSTLESLEKEAILHAFRFFRGNKTATARSLDIAVRTLDEKLKKYETEGKEQKDATEQLRAKDREFQLRQRGIDPATGRNLLEADTLAHAKSKDASNARTATGVRVESSQESAAKHAMPVSQRKEVQSVSPKQHAAGPSGKAR